MLACNRKSNICEITHMTFTDDYHAIILHFGWGSFQVITESLVRIKYLWWWCSMWWHRYFAFFGCVIKKPNWKSLAMKSEIPLYVPNDGYFTIRKHFNDNKEDITKFKLFSPYGLTNVEKIRFRCRVSSVSFPLYSMSWLFRYLNWIISN